MKAFPAPGGPLEQIQMSHRAVANILQVNVEPTAFSINDTSDTKPRRAFASDEGTVFVLLLML